jgi:hypothetical protein
MNSRVRLKHPPRTRKRSEHAIRERPGDISNTVGVWLAALLTRRYCTEHERSAPPVRDPTYREFRPSITISVAVGIIAPHDVAIRIAVHQMPGEGRAEPCRKAIDPK